MTDHGVSSPPGAAAVAPRPSRSDQYAGLRSVARAAVWAIVAPMRSLVRLWRRSIQARVVIGTVTLSAILTMLAGWVLLRQVADGLVDSKRQASETQAAAGVQAAQAKVDAAEVTDEFDVGPLMKGLVEGLAPRDEAREDFGVVLLGPLQTGEVRTAATGGSRASGDLDPASIPAALRTRVEESPDSWWAYSRVSFDGDSRPSVPGLVWGSQITVTGTGQRYGLFYVFPLREQQQSLNVVRNALITTGALLVVLLGVIAWLVTRQVVTPVRLARRIAERLASGRLEERMHVRGEDDIARLGTSFNQMAAGLQRQIRQLEELSRVQRRFVADVSHELRTPLTTVRMAGDVLHDAREDFDPAIARAAELLQNELDRFENLLTDLLEISRFDAGAAVLDLGDVDIDHLVHRVVDACQPLAERRGSSVVVRAPAEPCVAEADARRIERIVRNLVVNAIEYGEGRDVVVRVAASPDAVAVTVRDHGVGLKAGEDAMVFNRFWRADPARARTRGGTGLGLSIALEDTALHGGRLDAWGVPGRGSVFRLTLPRRAGDPLGSPPLSLVPEERPQQVPVGGPYERFAPARHRDLS